MFNEIGYLPAGVHEFSQDDLKKNFVEAFHSSSTRQEIFSGYIKHREALTLLVSCEQLIDGSFVSNKNDPNDVDLVCVIPAAEIDALDPDGRNKIELLVAGKSTQAWCRCDAYVMVSYPETDPSYEDYRRVRKYWLGEFGFDRVERPKGIAKTHLRVRR